MTDSLDAIEEQVKPQRNYEAPPLHLWHPPLSGAIDITIDEQGVWLHEGSPIQRESLVRLFASILRREDNGEYYLVTPAEKWQIQVRGHALRVDDVEEADSTDSAPLMYATLNTGRRLAIDEKHAIFLDAQRDHVAAMRLDHGLTALFSRPAWYRLVDMASNTEGVVTVRSGDLEFQLTPPTDLTT